MSWLVGGVTGILLFIPISFVIAGAWGTQPLLVVGLLVALLYGLVAVAFRPKGFLVSDSDLAIQWPVRQMVYPVSTLTSAEVLTASDFYQQFRWTVRVGAGGLFGTFGWLWTAQGWVTTYASRHDTFVLVRRAKGSPLLITPDRAEEFVSILMRAISQNNIA